MNPSVVGRVTTIICDDDPLARRALELLLRDPGIEVVDSCDSIVGCLQSMHRQAPQVAVIDLQLGGDRRGGIELIRAIRKMSPATLCLVLTATDARGELLPEAFFAGAHGFHRKGYVAGIELPQMVKRMAAGDWEFDRELASVLLKLVLAQTSVPQSPDDTGTILMPVECQVLKLLAEGKSAADAAACLHLPESTVHTYIRNITEKFHTRRERLQLGTGMPMESGVPVG